MFIDEEKFMYWCQVTCLISVIRRQKQYGLRCVWAHTYDFKFPNLFERSQLLLIQTSSLSSIHNYIQKWPNDKFTNIFVIKIMHLRWTMKWYIRKTYMLERSMAISDTGSKVSSYIIYKSNFHVFYFMGVLSLE